MLYVDLPSRSDVAALAGTRSDACVSIYLETTPLTQQVEASRIELGNLLREAQRQLEDAGFDKKRLAALLDQLSVLQDDAEFWRFQANRSEERRVGKECRSRGGREEEKKVREV